MEKEGQEKNVKKYFFRMSVPCVGIESEPVMKLLTEDELIWSPVVANNSMNRKRGASGVNSYEGELGFDPEAYLNILLRQQKHAKWLDMCCGEGNALLQYARTALKEGSQNCVTLMGIDLVGYFQPVPAEVTCVQFQTASLVSWKGNELYDLVTCVHGLHYIGDKLAALAAGLSLISCDGIMIANLDISSIKIEGDKRGAYLRKVFSENDIEYNVRKKLIRCSGTRNVDFNLIYRGADDKAGPNYTGQEAVDSYYTM